MYLDYRRFLKQYTHRRHRNLEMSCGRALYPVYTIQCANFRLCISVRPFKYIIIMCNYYAFIVISRKVPLDHGVRV